MKVSIERKKEEALARMRALKIFPETVTQFKEDGYVSVSEPPFGAFFWAGAEDLKRIENFERKYNALVYVVIRSYTSLGKMDSYLFVSDYDEEWEMDRKGIKNGEVLAYVYNHDMPDCSEIGGIGIVPTAAAELRRIW